MASDGVVPGQGQDLAVNAGSALIPFTALPLPSPTPGPAEQPHWEPQQPPRPPTFSSINSLMLATLPSPLLVSGDGSPGPRAASIGKVIIKVKTEGAESSETQSFVLSQTYLNWIPSGASCGHPENPSPQVLSESNMRALLPAEALGASQEGLLTFPPQALPPTAQLVPIMPPQKSWLGAHGSSAEGGSEVVPSKTSLSDLSYASKGVYENFRRWQCYKALARRHLSQSPDAEALSCFLIPVLRSLARLKPTMTLEEGLPRAVQEWDHTSNYDRMIFYEMAEKFMEFEAEEEIQVQNTKLINGSQALPPSAPNTLNPPGATTAEVCQQPVYIPKKSASKSRAPRRRQRKNQRPPVADVPKEIPPEAVKEYVDIMEGLMRRQPAVGEADGKQEKEEQQQDEFMYPDPELLNYIDELCSQEVFVSKVEAVIHPQFLADMLSSEQKDPLALMEELEQEEALSLAQLVEKRLRALEEAAEAPPSCSGLQWESSPSVSDEDEEGGGRLRPPSGARGAGGTPRHGKAASLDRLTREGLHVGQDGPHQEGGTLPPTPSGRDLQLGLAGQQGTEQRGSPRQDDHLVGVGPPEHSLASDRPSEMLPPCWQEDPQVGLAPCLSPLQGEGVGSQELQQQVGVPGVLPPEELLGEAPEVSSGVLWEEDRVSPLFQSFHQDPVPSADPDTQVALSPELWLGSEMEAISLELPLQVDEVIDSFQDGDCALGSPGDYLLLGSGSNISLDAGATAVAGELGTSVVPCGGTEGLEDRNCGSLALPADSLALKPKEREPSPEVLGSPSSLWADSCCSPMLESSVAASMSGVSKETLLSVCHGDHLVLEPSGAASYSEATLKVGSRKCSFAQLLGATGQLLDFRGDPGLQLAVPGGVESGSGHSNAYDPQEEGRKDVKDPAPLPQVPRTSKSSSSPQDFGGPSSGLQEVSVGREVDIKAKGMEEEDEEEDEELSNFAYLLASKLSLSPRALPLGPCLASGLSPAGKGTPRSSHLLSAEARGRQQPYPLAKSGKRALATVPVLSEKRSYPRADLEVSGENPPALGVARPSQKRKRRRDSFGTGRRKKRHRN